MYLRNKTAIITGISNGLGKAFTQTLLAQGVRVIGWGRTRPEYGHEHLEFVSCDVRDPESVEAALAATQALTDRIDILINNAGLGIFAPIDQLTLEQWRDVMETNLTGVFLVTRAVVPITWTRRSSRTGSWAGAEDPARETGSWGRSRIRSPRLARRRCMGQRLACRYPYTIAIESQFRSG